MDGEGVTNPIRQPIHTPQDPAEDAPKHWNYQKIKWLLFFSFLFLQMASRDLLEFHSGEPAGFMECAPVPLWRSPREMDGAGPRMKESSQPPPQQIANCRKAPKEIESRGNCRNCQRQGMLLEHVLTVAQLTLVSSARNLEGQKHFLLGVWTSRGSCLTCLCFSHPIYKINMIIPIPQGCCGNDVYV